MANAGFGFNSGFQSNFQGAFQQAAVGNFQSGFRPPKSPTTFRTMEVYYKCAEASYHTHDNLFKYLKKAFQNRHVKVIDQQEFHKWSVVILEVDGIRIAAFRGTDSLKNWVHNVANWSHVKSFQTDRMVQFVARHHSAHNQIKVFVGHSAGGFFANKCRKKVNTNSELFTFNGHLITTNNNRAKAYALRLHGCFVSKNFGNSTKDYRTLEGEGHKLKGFEQFINKDLHQLAPKYFSRSWGKK